MLQPRKDTSVDSIYKSMWNSPLILGDSYPPGVNLYVGCFQGFLLCAIPVLLWSNNPMAGHSRNDDIPFALTGITCNKRWQRSWGLPQPGKVGRLVWDVWMICFFFWFASSSKKGKVIKSDDINWKRYFIRRGKQIILHRLNLCETVHFCIGFEIGKRNMT